MHESNRIILFRVRDKMVITGLARDIFTVPGPVWTPASSVGFVAGAIQSGKRILLASGITTDSLTIRPQAGDPSAPPGAAIYAREIQTALAHGYTVRVGHSEQLSHPSYPPRTPKPAAFVLEPPPTPPRELFPSEQMRRLFDNRAAWESFPMNLVQLLGRFR